MHLSLKTLLVEILIEASFGKKFPITLYKHGQNKTLMGMATANAKPGERPYRITWFNSDFSDNRHVDLTMPEMTDILNSGTFPPEIIKRTKERYPDSDMIGDEYTLDILSPIAAAA